MYLYFSKSVIDENVKSFLEVDSICQYTPRGVASRISRQSGRFTYHPDPSLGIEFAEIGEPFTGQQLKRVLIRSSAKMEILDELNIYKITEEAVYPDLDGLSIHFNWLRETGKGI